MAAVTVHKHLLIHLVHSDAQGNYKCTAEHLQLDIVIDCNHAHGCRSIIAFLGSSCYINCSQTLNCNACIDLGHETIVNIP